MKIALRYIIFAVIATVVNVGLQKISFLAYSGYLSIYIAMGIGTLGGLLVKYYLDKKYIFYYITAEISEDITKFLFYSLMGVLTTVIFWGTELTFNALWEHPESKFVGAIVGLSIGYFIKYQLDKKFVFVYSQ